ncbi:glycosyltransferase family 4 protein [Amphibacillus indicireducens]|uniref:Glycosyltransferase family 4 protein n=1 Tax=Amphibacillus indicireducens TaxID=1076330 RepID=A0ABP7VJS5_9BACI
MKVSIVYMGDVNAKNGASKVVKSLIDNKAEFINNGITINNLYASKPYNQADQFWNKSKKNNLEFRAKLKLFLGKTMIGSIISLYLQYFRNAKISVKKVIESDDNSDLLIFHDIFSCYTYYKKKKNFDENVILVLHTNGDTWKMVYEYFPKLNKKLFNRFFNYVEKYVCENSNRIVFVSEMSAANFVGLRPEYKDKIACIYNGIDSSSDLANEIDIERLRMISVGTLNSRKAQNLIIESLAQIVDKSIKLTLVGDGEKKEEFYEIAENNQVLDQVDFLGSRNDVEEILRGHNLFIMSSKDEGLPISIIEAMKHGLPIIATNVGGIPELIDGNGILVEPDVESIKKAIEELNNNKTTLKEMSIKSRKIFEQKFTVNRMIKNYSDLIKEVIYEKN